MSNDKIYGVPRELLLRWRLGVLTQEDGDLISELLAKPADQYHEEPAIKFPDINELAAIIRKVDSNHSFGAGVLAEKILDEVEMLNK